MLEFYGISFEEILNYSTLYSITMEYDGEPLVFRCLTLEAPEFVLDFRNFTIEEKNIPQNNTIFPYSGF